MDTHDIPQISAAIAAVENEDTELGAALRQRYEFLKMTELSRVSTQIRSFIGRILTDMEAEGIGDAAPARHLIAYCDRLTAAEVILGSGTDPQEVAIRSLSEAQAETPAEKFDKVRRFSDRAKVEEYVEEMLAEEGISRAEALAELLAEVHECYGSVAKPLVDRAVRLIKSMIAK